MVSGSRLLAFLCYPCCISFIGQAQVPSISLFCLLNVRVLLLEIVNDAVKLCDNVFIKLCSVPKKTHALNNVSRKCC